MKDFTITITGKKENDGSGRIAWRHMLNNHILFGDHVTLPDYDEEYARALPLVAEQAAQMLEKLYGGNLLGTLYGGELLETPYGGEPEKEKQE